MNLRAGLQNPLYYVTEKLQNLEQKEGGDDTGRGKWGWQEGSSKGTEEKMAPLRGIERTELNKRNF